LPTPPSPPQGAWALRCPDGVAACPLVWSHWADRLAATRPPEPE
jgi:hypothetical protein